MNHPNAFMDSQEIGIEGKIYPAEKQTVSSTDEKVFTKKEIQFSPKKFPKTNEDTNSLEMLGLLMIGITFILMMTKKVFFTDKF